MFGGSDSTAHKFSDSSISSITISTSSFVPPNLRFCVWENEVDSYVIRYLLVFMTYVSGIREWHLRTQTLTKIMSFFWRSVMLDSDIFIRSSDISLHSLCTEFIWSSLTDRSSSRIFPFLSLWQQEAFPQKKLFIVNKSRYNSIPTTMSFRDRLDNFRRS